MTTMSPQTQEAIRPPEQRLDPIQWLRQNLFDSWLNTALTIISVAVVAWAVLTFTNWALNQATWAVIPSNLKVLATGVYPADQVWRAWIVLGIVMAVLGVAAGAWQGVLLQYVSIFGGFLVLLGLLGFVDVPVLRAADGDSALQASRLPLLGTAAATAIGLGIGWKREMWRPWTLGAGGLVLPLCLWILLGAIFGQEGISSQQLSGLMLTLILASAALILAFPVGVLLALGRSNGDLPVIKVFCTLVIEMIRGVPLTTTLFAAWLLVPLFLRGITVDLLIRAEVGFILFTAVYVAEDVRGGLQSVPRGQVEAAKALGLNPFQITMLVVLPQALRAAVPALVNEFLTLFKDTSLVFIIGMVDLLGAGRVIYTNPDWLGTQKEVLFFVALVYFCCCYGMAYGAKQVERSLGLGQR